MASIECRGGHTQIGRVLAHAIAETRRERIRGLILVGDAVEEGIDDLCAAAGELALLSVPVFVFQEGYNKVAERAFREIARLTRGAWSRFDLTAAGQLSSLLRAVAAYAAGGHKALLALAGRGEREAGAHLLLEQIGRP
jgi:hypothetical protein